MAATYTVRGQFESGHTFSLAAVPADDARAALSFAMSQAAISEFGSPVVKVLVKRASASKRIRISKEPAKPRERKATAPAPAASTHAAPSVKRR